jgi:hypothetical protein
MNDLKTTKTDWIQSPLQDKEAKTGAVIAEPSGTPRGSLVMSQEILRRFTAMTPPRTPSAVSCSSWPN